MSIEISQDRSPNTFQGKAITPLTYIPSLSASGKYIVGTIDCGKMRTLAIGCQVTYHASATSGCKINVYHSPDGDLSNFDTVPYASFTVDLTVGKLVKETHNFDIPEDGLLSIEVQNTDTTYACTLIQTWAIVARWRGV